MITEKEMKLIHETLIALNECTEYSISLNNKIIYRPEDIECAAAEVVAYFSQNDFFKVIANNKGAA